MATIWQTIVHKMLAGPYPRFLRSSSGETLLQRSPAHQIHVPDPKTDPSGFGAFVGNAKDLTVKRDALAAYLRERKNAFRIQLDLEELLEVIAKSDN